VSFCMRISSPTKIKITLVWLIILVGLSVHGGALAQEESAGADDGFVNFPAGAQVRVSPAAFTYGDEVTVSIYGLTGDFILSPGHVDFGSVDISMPGYFGYPGVRPVSDDQGTLVFTTRVSDDLEPGSQYLTVDIEDIFRSRASVDMLPISLQVSSSTVVPNQEVWVMGHGFTSDSSGNRRWRQVTGHHPSVVSIEGIPVPERLIDYPLKIDRKGFLIFNLVIPNNKSTTRAGEVELRVTDARGRVGAATLTIPEVVVSVSPRNTRPNEVLTLSASGLEASNPALGLVNEVSVEYGAINGKGRSKWYLWSAAGQWTTDDTGGLSATFKVPGLSRLSSSNRLRLAPTFGEPITYIHRLSAHSIESDPKRVFPGDKIDITVKGMEPGTRLAVWQVALEGARIPIPGYLGHPGTAPAADDSGSLTFTSYIPIGISPGEKQLTAEFPGDSTENSKLTIKEGGLTFEPSMVVPGEAVELISSRFDTATDAEGRRLYNVRVTGLRDSSLFMANARLDANTVDYPISLDRKGRLNTTFKIPVNSDTIHARQLEFTAVDTAGRTSSGTVSIKRSSITVSPEVSTRGTYVTVDGAGFPTGKMSGSGYRYQVLIDYGGKLVARAVPGVTGTFRVRFQVPSTVKVNSINTVTAVLERFPSVKAQATHQVPDAQLVITPAAAPVGGVVSISGTGFRLFSQVVFGLGHQWMVPQPAVYTDINGDFKTEFTVPAGLKPGTHALTIYAPYPSNGSLTAYTVASGASGR
jgi:hypothetical protein